MHGLQWDYSFPRSPHGEKEKYSLRLFENKVLRRPKREEMARDWRRQHNE
jgi:hypothetical protein